MGYQKGEQRMEVKMSKLFTLSAGAVLAAATWFLLFVLLGTGLGTAFIACGVVLAAGVVATAMIAAGERGASLDVPVTTVGLLAGISAFAVLEIVLAVPMWVGVVTGAGVTGLYEIARALVRPVHPSLEDEPTAVRRPQPASVGTNGHERRRGEAVGAR
jgi:hypothetical protein